MALAPGRCAGALLGGGADRRPLRFGAEGGARAATRPRRGARRSFPRTPTAPAGPRLPASGGGNPAPRFWGAGKRIYFTAVRGGSPHAYRKPAAGGEPQRVT